MIVAFAVTLQDVRHPVEEDVVQALAGCFAGVLALPSLRVFFALDLPPLPVALAALALVAALGGLLALAVLRLRL